MDEKYGFQQWRQKKQQQFITHGAGNRLSLDCTTRRASQRTFGGCFSPFLQAAQAFAEAAGGCMAANLPTFFIPPSNRRLIVKCDYSFHCKTMFGFTAHNNDGWVGLRQAVFNELKVAFSLI